MRGTGLIVITVQRELYIGAAFAAFYKAAGASQLPGHSAAR